MTKNVVKQMVEQVVKIEFIAEDGKIFTSEEECEKYEESALFAISKELKRLNTKNLSTYDLFEGSGSEDDEAEIFDIQTDKDLENLRRYLYLKAKNNGATENNIKECFTSKDGISRKDFVFDGVTKGHEVIVCWNYERDWFWVYRDGSIDGYLSFIEDKITRHIIPKKEETK